MTDKLGSFIAKWQSSGGEERANKDAFLIELCEALDLPRPEPKTGDDERDTYVFEKDVLVAHENGKRSTRKIDLYNHGRFLLEAKQGSNKGAKKLGTAKRDTPAWHQAMSDAYGQALGYVSFLDQPPPFLIVCDLGYCFDLYADFDGTRRYNPFPSAQRKRIYLSQLADPKVRELLRTLFLGDPLDLDPSRRAARATREIAESLADLARRLESAGHPQRDVARFLMRCLFTMFAEDVSLLPDHVFTTLLRKHWLPNPDSFPVGIEQLWRTMKDGGVDLLTGKLLRFNGGLFTDASSLPLNREALKLLLDAAEKDWSEVEPAIFGTLLERALDPKERHRLGAHYTPRSYVERLVRPTIEEPLRADWNVVQAHVRQLLTEAEGAKPAQAEKLRKQAVKEVKDFHRTLCSLKVLDPACGTGNFLYVTMDLFRRIENEVLTLLDSLGERGGLLALEGVRVTPAQFLGIEIKQWAKEIAELVLWIGFLQGQIRSLPPRKKGEPPPVPEPVLQDYKNIECRDAILAYDGEPQLVLDESGKPIKRWDGETYKRDPLTGRDVPDEKATQLLYSYRNPRQATWPKADFIIGNPPFLGNKRMKRALGMGYSETLRKTYQDVPESADLVMYWWHRAALVLVAGEVRRFGLITTNSITQSFNRRIVESALETGKMSLAFAIPDHPWTDTESDAAVRIAMTVAAPGVVDGVACVVAEEQETGEGVQVELRTRTGKILPDLTSGIDVLSVTQVQANQGLAFTGMYPLGQGFVLSPADVARATEGHVEEVAFLKPFFTAKDLTRVNRQAKIIDFYPLDEGESRDRYPHLFQWTLMHVKPLRDQNPVRERRDNWWLFTRPIPQLRAALDTIDRYILVPRTSKRFTFQFRPSNAVPDTSVVAIATSDAFILAILSSTIHATWAVRTGGRLGVGNDPRYQHKSTFRPFPFPDPPDPLRQRIRDLGEQLDAFRKKRQAEHPELTITEMYNVLEKLRRGEALVKKEPEIHQKGLISTLRKIHDDLDAAVFEAYGWPATLTDEEILERLVALNAERAAEERQGKVRWLRPEFQNPQGAREARQLDTPDEDEGEESGEGEEAAAAKKPSWPKKTKEQIIALRDLLTRHTEAWTVRQVVAAFKGADGETVEEILESLEALGTLVAYVPEGSTERHWKRALALAEVPAVAARKAASLRPPRASAAVELMAKLEGLNDPATRRRSSDLAVNQLDDWLSEGRFDDVNELLAVADPGRFHPSTTLAILSVSRPARERLGDRAVFIERARIALVRALGAERAERLLAPCL